MVIMKKILLLILTLCSLSGIVHSDITWSSPTAISTVLTDASDPQTVIDASGNATAAWVENDTIVASSLPFGGSWSSPVTISNVLNTSSKPQLGIDSSGNVTALWIESGLINSATLPFGGSWSASTTVSGSGATHPVLDVDASGNAVAVWVRSGFVESSTRISGTWSLVAVLSVTNSDNPHIAISNFGTAIAAWHSIVSGADVLTSNILTISGNSWGTPKNVLPETTSLLQNFPKIAIDENGNATIAWFRYVLLNSTTYQNVQVMSSSLVEGAAAWDLPTVISNTGIRNPADLTIKLEYDLLGDTLLLWTNSYDGQTFSIESSQRLFGGPWPGFTLPQSPSLYSFGIDLAIASGTALLTNMSWDGSSAIFIQSQESDITDPILQGWTATTTFSTGNDNAYPQCAMSQAGGSFNAVAVWLHFDGSNIVIHASAGTEAVIDPPSSVSATQNLTDFGVYQDYFNTITWSASSDPNVIQYNIYRNGVYFAATLPGTLTIDDHNQIQGETVIYGVAALTSSFRQSELVTFTLVP